MACASCQGTGVGVGGQPVAEQMQDVPWCQGGLSVSWHVKILAMFGKLYGLFGGDLSYESRELRPASAFLARLLCYCCFCCLCISFIKKEAFGGMHCHRL